MRHILRSIPRALRYVDNNHPRKSFLLGTTLEMPLFVRPSVNKSTVRHRTPHI